MTALHEQADARALARMAKQLASAGDLSQTGDRIVALARTVVGCDEATLWTLDSQDGLVPRASTDPGRAQAEAVVIAAAGSGPERDCLASGVETLFDDLRLDPRWRDYRGLLSRAIEPPGSGLVLPVGMEGGSRSALALTSRLVDHFDEERAELAAAFADHASAALEAAAQRSRADHLERALELNRRIGMAIGIVMASQRRTEEQAFRFLRVASQRVHVKLREIAEDVICTGAARGASPAER